ncbi:MAG: LamG domain-containing protein, partial [Gemmataceae bacterium]|nr:LamG domain-containing protein [Gemmataceae bacterium]
MAAVAMPTFASADEAELRKAVLLYASFDVEVRADFGAGSHEFGTRTGKPGDPKTYVFAKGFDAKNFRIAPGKGVQGGALEVLDILPENGRIYLPVRGHLAYRRGGWGGAVSFWFNTDPNTRLKTPFCDPVQITQKGANNGGIWLDFTAAKPRRSLRMGIFPAVPEGQKGIGEDHPDAPLVTIPNVDYKTGEWHHVVLSWRNLDTGRPDAHAELYLDGQLRGAVKDRAIAMDWDVDKAGIFVAVNFIGLMDELATFARPLTADEVALLHR